MATRTFKIEILGDAKGVGSALADAEQGAMKLEGALKQVDNVTVDQVGSRTRKVAGEMDHLSDRTDNSRSVMANFAGNAVQTLPGVTGAMGPLNMAIGQFGEYATEGNISLSKLVGTGLAIGAAAAVMQGLSSAAEKQAKLDLWRKGEVEAWTEAVKDGSDTVEGLTARLREAGEISVGIGNQKLDITPLLAGMGISVDQFAEAALNGKEGVDKLGAALKEAGVDADAAGIVIKAAGEQVKFHEAATKAASAWQKVYGEESATATEKFEHNALAVRDMKDAADEQGKSLGDLNDEFSYLETGVLSQTVAQQNAAIAIAATKDHVDDAKRAVQDWDLAWQALTGTLSDESALIGINEDVDDLREKLWLAMDAGKTGAADAEVKQRDYQKALIGTKEDVIAYGKEIGLLPSHVKTLIDLADNGQIEAMENRLAILARNRTMQLSIIAKGGSGVFTVSGIGAEGGVVTQPTRAILGDNGPEAVVPLSQMPGAFPLPSSLGAGGGYQPIIVNVYNAGSTITEKDLVRSVYDGIIDGQRRGELVGSL